MHKKEHCEKWEVCEECKAEPGENHYQRCPQRVEGKVKGMKPSTRIRQICLDKKSSDVVGAIMDYLDEQASPERFYGPGAHDIGGYGFKKQETENALLNAALGLRQRRLMTVDLAIEKYCEAISGAKAKMIDENIALVVKSKPVWCPQWLYERIIKDCVELVTISR